MSQIAHRLPMIDKAIWDKVGDLDAPITKKKHARCGTERGDVRSTNIPDDVVLEIRRLHEKDRWTYKQLLEHFPQYSRTWMRSVLDYDLRANLKVAA